MHIIGQRRIHCQARPPCRVEEVIELDLSDQKQAEMQASGDHVCEVIEAYENLADDA